ncbi:MAG: trypsin-like serine protease [Chromatiaceae bacterium]|nr:trypsin-like serine protease [Candidatus Thioaporhodococcus sediminis]
MNALSSKLLPVSVALAASLSAAWADGSAAAPHRRLAGDPSSASVATLAQDDQTWTPERYRYAEAMPLIPVASVLDPARDDVPVDPSRVSAPGQPPQALNAAALDRIAQQLFEPAPDPAVEPMAEAPSADQAVLRPQDAGSAGAYFSSQPLVPLTADTSYPYQTVGKLFFTQPGVGDFTCSAAVIRPRLILTAGHCVHSGRGAWFTNFRFIPAYRDGAAPFGQWSAAWVTTTTPWINGGGAVPNAADYALIELNDQPVGGATRRIGDVVGYLGYATHALLPNHAHLLGYPAAFDGGGKMHQVTSASFQSGGNNTVLYGSDMTGGSSGGPWLQNFGPASAGQSGGLKPGRNQVIGVTSYGYTDAAVKTQGSSILNDTFVALMTGACGHRAGNCP